MDALSHIYVPIPLPIAQVLRLMCIAAFPAIITLSFSMWGERNMVREQRYRFLALGFLAASACYTAILRYHDRPTLLLVFNIAGCTFAVLGLLPCREGARRKWLGQKRDGE